MITGKYFPCLKQSKILSENSVSDVRFYTLGSRVDQTEKLTYESSWILNRQDTNQPVLSLLKKGLEVLGKETIEIISSM